jgi:hypothetical protein
MASTDHSSNQGTIVREKIDVKICVADPHGLSDIFKSKRETEALLLTIGIHESIWIMDRAQYMRG